MSLLSDLRTIDSAGACDLNWSIIDNAGRLKLMQRYVTMMLHEDNIQLDAVIAAIIQIENRLTTSLRPSLLNESG
jgi:hypothetical protein